MESNKSKDSFLKGAIILGVAGIVVKIMGAFFRIPLGNLIGSKGMGYYQAAYPVYTLFLTLATAGFPTALAKLVSEKTAIGDHKGANKIFKVAYTVLLITGVLSFCLLFFGADYIVTDLMKNPDAYYAMLAIAPALLFVPAMSSYRGYFQGKRDMSKIAISQVTEQFFRVILGIAMAYYFMQQSGPKMGAAGAIVGATIGSIGSITYLIIVYLKESKQRKADIKASKRFKDESVSKILKKILLVAIPITIGASVMPLVNMIDNIVVIRRLVEGGFTRTEAVSLFGQLTGMAMAIVNLPSVITSAIGMSLVPSISESFALGKVEKARKETRSAIKVTLLVVLPCAFGIASLAGPIMQLLYPKEPASLGTILFTISPAIIFLGLIFSLNGILQGMGKPMVPVLALSVGMIFKIAISYTLTVDPDINVLGSGLGTVTAYAVASLIEIHFVKKYMGVKFGINEFVIKPLITVVTMFAAVKLSYGLITNSVGLGNSLATVISIVIGAVVYVLVLLGIGGITKEEILIMPKGEKLYKVLRKLHLIR
ncbi:putative polysaccharide biosynthesis protein [Romboutsia sp. 1001713B170207_170306_H8]|uniref:putative polysaccharide biosynthesis protein n=1 Tax=Romboutsia sp. 1001713B170207_170306_H8 TaxID=2787112 RepID=UPI0008216FFC|nr:polysaccharide biosynthesis protein [Romboutsia sp. 1001713B170207_170306_H8]SCI37992.1 Probable cell division protein ytgP [uncultured Clostridium sp.]